MENLLLIFVVVFVGTQGTATKPKLVFKVHCPKEKHLKSIVTTKRPGDNFEVQCHKSSEKEESTQNRSQVEPQSSFMGKSEKHY